MSDDDVWFEPKRFGVGAGLPVSWQGWALLLGYIALAIVGAVWLAPSHRALLVVLLVIATVPLMILSARHTRGGWRWRWGGD